MKIEEIYFYVQFEYNLCMYYKIMITQWLMSYSSNTFSYMICFIRYLIFMINSHSYCLCRVEFVHSDLDLD